MGGGEIWHRLETFVCHYWRGYYWHLLVNAWNAAKHSKVQDTPAQQRIFQSKCQSCGGGETQCEPYFSVIIIISGYTSACPIIL